MRGKDGDNSHSCRERIAGLRQLTPAVNASILEGALLYLSELSHLKAVVCSFSKVFKAKWAWPWDLTDREVQA